MNISADKRSSLFVRSNGRTTLQFKNSGNLTSRKEFFTSRAIILRSIGSKPFLDTN